MTTISQELITQLESQVSLKPLIEAKGIALKQEGDTWMGRCPFHDDAGLSLAVNPTSNRWKCQGGCQVNGTVVDWVVKAEGVSHRHAVEILRNNLPVSATSSPQQPVKFSSVRRLDAPFDSGDEDPTVLKRVVGYYHETLKRNPEALEYLAKHGLGSAEAIDKFHLGYANRTLGYRLPQKNRIEGGALRGQLQRLGILRASGHEHFHGALVIPVIDEIELIADLYGRRIGKSKDGVPVDIYLSGPSRGLWNLDALKASKEIILCRGLIDALTFWCAGYRNVTALHGTDGLTPERLELLKRFKVECLLIAYGNTEADNGAASALAERLLAEGFGCFRIVFQAGMDASDCAQQSKQPAKRLGALIRGAAWLGKGKAPSIQETTSTGDDMEPPAAVPTETVAAEATTPCVCEQPSCAQEPPPRPDTASVEPETIVPPSLSVLLSQNESDELPALPATVIPEAAAPEPATETRDDEVVIQIGDRRYRVRGFGQNLSHGQMRVNVLASRPAPDGVGELIHVDSFDLYLARHRATFIRQTSIELMLKEDAIKKDVGRVLLKLEALQAELIARTLAPKDKHCPVDGPDRDEALAFLKEPNLVQRILLDFERCGLVGEETNKLVGYLAATSRKLDSPLAVLVQSSSAAGKSSLMDAVLALMPEEDKVQYSAVTGQSLFYMDHGDLHHKILALAEEEGASRATYALKLLQSEGALTIASTGKDRHSGKLVAQEYRVEGPVMIFSTTTAIDRDEELLNRCLILGVDESRNQTRAILKLQRQRRTLAGLVARKDKERILKVHRNAQRLLRPLAVMNPYADVLTFRDDRTRLRRDHEKYLTLIDTDLPPFLMPPVGSGSAVLVV
jgi:DNA primase catalytic core